MDAKNPEHLAENKNGHQGPGYDSIESGPAALLDSLFQICRVIQQTKKILIGFFEHDGIGLDGNDESFAFREAFLVRVEGQEMARLHHFRRRHMEDVKRPMPVTEGVDRRESVGFGEDVGEIEVGFDQSSG